MVQKLNDDGTSVGTRQKQPSLDLNAHETFDMIESKSNF